MPASGAPSSLASQDFVFQCCQAVHVEVVWTFCSMRSVSGRCSCAPGEACGLSGSKEGTSMCLGQPVTGGAAAASQAGSTELLFLNKAA